MASKRGNYHHGDLKVTLIRASLELIREHGVGALSLREAARRAGVSPSAPYHHFQSRSHLLCEIAIQGFDLLRDHLASIDQGLANDNLPKDLPVPPKNSGTTEAANSPSTQQPTETAPSPSQLNVPAKSKDVVDPLGMLFSTGVAYVDFALAHPEYFKVMFLAELADAELFPELTNRKFLLLQYLYESLRALQSCGLAPKLPLESLVLTSWSTIHGLSTLMIDGPLGGKWQPIKVARDEMAEVVTSTLYGLFLASADREIRTNFVNANKKSLIGGLPKSDFEEK